MEDKKPLDIVDINSDDDEEPIQNNINNSDKPIIQLFKRLINSDNKQSTVLTNAQIVDILNKEFNINLWDIHELEGEIYLTIMKKYLKDWPQWDEFDRVINSLKTKSSTEQLDRMLESNYWNLKEYLKVMLERAQSLAKSTVNKMIDEKAKISKDSKSDDVVLEIHATRNQLNQLFFRRPHPELNDTVFNGTYSGRMLIKIDTLPIEAILNWWNVKVTIQRDSTCFYQRKTCHQLNHVLVNKNLMARYNPLKVLPQQLQYSNVPKKEKRTSFPLTQYLGLIDRMMRQSPNIEPILSFIRLDLQLLPSMIYSRSSFRRYTNKYPYIRYLYKEVENPDINSRKYDLQLEETLSPMYRVYMGPVQLTHNATVEIECSPCQRKFFGSDIIMELKEHFADHHMNEPDWKCTNCNKVFPMAELAQKWWTHRC